MIQRCPEPANISADLILAVQVTGDIVGDSVFSPCYLKLDYNRSRR